MQTEPIGPSRRRQSASLALLALTLIMVTACASIGNVSSAVSGAATGAAVLGSQAPSGATAAAGTTPGAQVSGAASSAQCQTIGDAYIDFEGEYPFLAIASDSAYVTNTPDSPAYINIPKLRADLTTLATLPGGTVGPTAAALAQFGQLVDLVDSNIKSGGKPFSDGSGNGQKVLDLYLKLTTPYIVVAEAFAGACPHYSAATAAPDKTRFQIGQTASVGDLRVTLNKVVQPALNGQALPTAGNRILFVYVTITNTGTSPLKVSGLSETSLVDAAGGTYGWDPFANGAAGTASDNVFDGQIPPVGTGTGLESFQIPLNAGDLTWIFQDYGNHRAAFAVKTSDIDTSGASSAPTEDAARSSAGATMTELMNMVATSDSADMTATAAPPDAAAPTDTPAP